MSEASTLVSNQFELANNYAYNSFIRAFDSIGDIKDSLETLEYATLVAWLDDVLTNGGIGLTVAAQQDLWDLETERDALALVDAKDSKASDWATGGWPLGDGILEASLLLLDRDYLNKRLDKSREIRAKAEELAIANTHFAVQRYAELVIGYNAVAEKGMESIASTAATLAAGALSAAHAQASLGASESSSSSTSSSAQTSIGTYYNHNYSE